MKNIAKKFLVPILSNRPVASIADRIFGRGTPIFMLHRMDTGEVSTAGGTSPDHLRLCLQYLVKHGYHFISLEEIVTALAGGLRPPPRAVAFTMDDGYADQARVAAPIFEEFSCPLTFFVITGMLDQTLWPWDAQVAWITTSSEKHTLVTEFAGRSFTLSLRDNANRRQAKRELYSAIRQLPSGQVADVVERIARDAGVEVPEQAPAAWQPMSWNMARNLEDRGIQFAPHSVSHHILSRLDDASMTREINDSWKTLSRELHHPSKLFCYPTGRETDYGNREIEVLRRNGFLAAVTTTPGFAEQLPMHEQRLFRLPRFSLPESTQDFIQCCTWIEYVKSKHKMDCD